MCGICGVIGRDPRLALVATRRMMAAMVHRGPDDDGFEQLSLGQTDAVAAFGFRRLSILDLSQGGHQPMVERRTGDCLVFNGEIYNFRALRARLMAEGVRFQSSGDAEVLLQALCTWGERALNEIEGMFALAFYQASSGRVLLARDPVGIKPLYVSLSARRLAFASEVRGLLSSGLVDDELDPAGVAGFLMYGAPQDPLTVHRYVRSFPSGSFQWFDYDDASHAVLAQEPRRFWSFPAVVPNLEEREAAQSLRKTLTTAVGNHLASDVEMAFFLSAGVDSTVIATLAAQQIGRISTYSVGFDSPSMESELTIASDTARALGSHHTEIVLGTSTIRDLWSDWLAAADRPSVDGLNTYLICRAVREAGATVAFSGLGADELFGGYANFFRVRKLAPVLRSLSLLPGPIRRAAFHAGATVSPKRYQARVRSLATTSGRWLDIGISLKQFLSVDTLQSLGLDASQLGLRPDYLAPDVEALFLDGLNDPFVAVSRVETHLYMGNTLLRDADVNSMAHSVELRVPFVARPVLEAAGEIPGKLHLGGQRQGKYLLRQAVSDLLPEAVRSRPKTGFSLPINDWLFGRLRESCEASVAALGNVPFLNQEGLQALWQDFTAKQSHNYWMKPLLLVALGDYVSRIRDRSTPVL